MTDFREPPNGSPPGEPAADEPRPARGRRSGSEKRVRQRLVGYRADDQEYERVREDASRAGLTVASYVRATVHSRAPLRAVPLSRFDRELLRAVLGQLGKIGSNVNQLGRAANSRLVLKPEQVAAFFEAFLEMRTALFEALGRDPQ